MALLLGSLRGRYRRYLSLREGSEQAPPGAALKARRRTYEMAAILGVGVVRLLRGIALIVSSSHQTDLLPQLPRQFHRFTCGKRLPKFILGFDRKHRNGLQTVPGLT